MSGIFSRIASLLLLMVCAVGPSFTASASTKDAPPLNQLRFSRLLTGVGQDYSRNINAILSIAQDKTGYMWFAGESGLARYDGVDFKIFQTDVEDPTSLSSNYIWDMVVDEEGQLWLATLKGLNRYNPDTQDFSHFGVEEKDAASSAVREKPGDTLFCLELGSDNSLWVGGAQGLYRYNSKRDHFEVVDKLLGFSIRSLKVDGEKLWVGTMENGLFRLEKDLSVSGHWKHDSKHENSLPNNYVRSIERGPKDQLWVGTMGGGLARMIGEDRFHTYRSCDQKNCLPSNSVWDIHTDKHGYLWMATDPGGLALYSFKNDSFEVFSYQEYDLNSLSSNKVRAVFDDALGDLWVGLFPSGINYLDKSTALFKNFGRDGENAQGLLSSSITAVEEISTEKVFIGTEGGLNEYNPVTQTFTPLSGQHWGEGIIPSSPILSIEKTRSGEVWLGTWGEGAYRLNIESQELTHFSPNPGDEGALGDAYVWSLLEDSQGRLWVGTENSGLFLFDQQTQKFQRFSPEATRKDSLSFSHVWALIEDSNKDIWVGTIDGLNRLIAIDDKGAHFQHFRAGEDTNTLSSNRIISLMEDHKGYIWVGTQDSGLNRLDPRTENVLRIGIKEGLPSSHISSITQDKNKDIWITTSNGIARIDYLTEDVITYTQNRGLISNNFNRNASAFLKNGELIVGSSGGVTVFNPSSIKNSTHHSNIIATDFKLFNQAIKPGDPNGILSKAIDNTNAVSLSDEQNMFTVDFALLSYRAAQLNEYAYKLEGFDKHWNYVKNQRSATYTNLDPGHYQLFVKAANASGEWVEPKQILNVQIKPPFYQSYWAYLMAALAVSWIGWLLFNAHRRNLELGHQKEMADKLVKLDRMKDEFLANTSHELRTPLNGIIGLAEAMIEGGSGELNQNMHHNLRMISSSGRRLSNLINDILDYSKLREEKLQIQLRPTNLNMIVDAVFELIEPLIGKKTLVLESNLAQPIYILADEDRMQQVLLNLVGNAIKFSYEGYVKVSAEKHDDLWAISVEDTGSGIAEKDRSKIFNAFTQLDGDETRSAGGTGLGLAITKQLIELQGGNITMKSALGKGSTFTITMRAAKEDINSKEVGLKNVDEVLPARLNRIVDTGRDETLSLLKPSESCQDYSVLIVDDDPVNRMVLSGMLKLQEYQIIEAESGMEAVSIVESGKKIDLIILDVMMPQMSGYEACMRIRAILPVHVMPILFLTAKNFSDDLVRGFVAGGNDFLTKPVSKHELLSRVSTHLSLLDVNRRLEERVKDSQYKNIANSRELHALSHIVDTINRELDFNVLLKEVLVDVKELIQADHVAYWRVDNSGKRFCVVAEVGKTSSKTEICVLDAESLDVHLDNLYNYGHSIIVLDKFDDKTFDFVVQAFEGCQSSLLMTIYFENKVVGFITIVNYETNEGFDDTAIDTLHRVRAHVTSAVVKASLLEKLNLHVTRV